VEIIVWAALAIAVVAILGRFVLRSGGGEVVLPRIVDDSIGMWLLRRATGRRLWEREPEEDADAEAGGVAVMAASAAPKATGIAPAERPIRILALPPATIDATPWTAERTRPASASIDHLARRARPAALPTRYRPVAPPDDRRPSADLAGGPADRAEAVPSGTMGPSG
jgi:hypothetical protein